ncbi:hypothetical protein ONS95_006314 [Cadophora gregata]|uniref:uncharacterized protein n=1 Tax=Cadophora gregata TaxID=51156 RepID=UPI0026DBC6F6|nr:uncharacterized protein ONS95_006314 [Cadophora gregata]KAK0099326.1 hypothetical protein ONS96_008554 [Cadophora gregata f. sp. sojae]KAK0102712.1 hypothetical protein ONS95_006314 [Cadophora gregata]
MRMKKENYTGYLRAFVSRSPQAEMQSSPRGGQYIDLHTIHYPRMYIDSENTQQYRHGYTDTFSGIAAEDMNSTSARDPQTKKLKKHPQRLLLPATEDTNSTKKQTRLGSTGWYASRASGMWFHQAFD